MVASWNDWLHLNETLLNRQWFESDMEFVCLFDWLNMCAVCCVCALWICGCVCDYLFQFFYPQFFCFNHYERKQMWRKKSHFIERHEPCYAGYMRFWLLRKSTRENRKKRHRRKTNHFHMRIVWNRPNGYMSSTVFGLYFCTLYKLKMFIANTGREDQKKIWWK